MIITYLEVIMQAVSAVNKTFSLPEILLRLRSDPLPHTLESMNNLITLYEAWGKPEQAEEWREKLPQTKTVEQ